MQNEAIFKFNHIYGPVFTTQARYIDIWGGRAAGRSHFGTDYFLYKLTQPEYFRGCFMRHVFSDIRDSLFQDFKDRLEDSAFDEKDFKINESSMTISYLPTGNTIISKGFRKSSGNRSAKLKSLAGITHVLIEEADENMEEDINKLDDSIRTDKIENIQVIFLHNSPSKNHWICKRFYNLEDSGIDGYYRAIPKEDKNLLVIFSTYLDNIKNLNKKTIEKYKAYKDPNSIFYNPEYYYVDVCGLIPEGAKGRIYPGFYHISYDFFKKLPYPSIYGLDFGFSGGKAALVEIKTHNNRNFWHELIYEEELTNPELAEKMRALGLNKSSIIYADTAEPKSIKELKNLGFYAIKEADKGPDSIIFGIKKIRSMENYMTENSKNLWFENEEYKWELDKNGESTGVPIKKYNHAKDAGRYAITTHRNFKKGDKLKMSV